MNTAEEFMRAGAGFIRAREILVAGCQIPPSFEVFSCELARARVSNGGITPEGMARRIADGYHRTDGFFPPGRGEFSGPS